jgi:hypothetical protein
MPERTAALAAIDRLSNDEIDALSREELLDLLASAAPEADRAATKAAIREQVQRGRALSAISGGQYERVLTRYQDLAAPFFAAKVAGGVRIALASAGQVPVGAAVLLRSEGNARPTLVVPADCTSAQLREAFNRLRSTPQGATTATRQDRILLQDLDQGATAHTATSNLAEFERLLRVLTGGAPRIQVPGFGDLPLISIT